MSTIAQKAPEAHQQHVTGNDISKDVAVSTASDEHKSRHGILSNDTAATPHHQETIGQLDRAKSLLGYVKTKHFWIVLFFGQILSWCIVGTNTLSQKLSLSNANIPAFQSFFAYVLLCFIWTPITMYKLGFKGWAKMVWKQGWKYLILSFFDVEGNYFTVLGFKYTNVLSAQLINFWAIVVVVILSFLFLHVRYRWLAILGILICIGGTGLLIASDKIRGTNDYAAPNALKGDLFALLGATCYGFSNTLQEFMVSKRPLYEVVGMIALFGIFINGTQAAIFDRDDFQATVWTADVGGYLAGFDLILVIFYSLAPLVFRMGSAAFLNISLLTGNFWGALIGIKVFGLSVHYLYPIAFVLIVVGLIVYFLYDSPMGDSAKPWLGENQERGVDGIGTARRRVEHDVIV